jgi:protocatechuate 3,4-dioxygenase beta subunit
MFKAARRRALLCAVSALFLGLNPLNAQATGTITGTVTDATGASVPDATVQMKNTGTGAVESVTTDAAGRYTVPQLAIGRYDVQASKMASIQCSITTWR